MTFVVRVRPPLFDRRNKEGVMPDISIACTLLPGEFKTRLEELAALSETALLSATRDDLTLHLRYAPDAEKRVRRMVEKEQECCAFLNFEFIPDAFAITVRITAPESARDGVQEIYAQFVSADAPTVPQTKQMPSVP